MVIITKGNFYTGSEFSYQMINLLALFFKGIKKYIKVYYIENPQGRSKQKIGRKKRNKITQCWKSSNFVVLLIF